MKKAEITKEYARRIYERLDQVRIKKGISWAEIVRQLEILGVDKVGRTTPNDWKNGKSSSFLNCIGEICSILEISVEDIQIVERSGNNIINSINESPNSTLTITENNLSKQERELVEIYRNLSLMGQMDLITYALKLKNGGQ